MYQSFGNKKNHKFIVFDIKYFYPSISEKLLCDAIQFTKSVATISEQDVDIINHARKSLCFSNSLAWMRSPGNTFNVTMGAFDRAEVCKVLGIFLQHKLSNLYAMKNFGLYRDGGLSVHKNTNCTKFEPNIESMA